MFSYIGYSPETNPIHYINGPVARTHVKIPSKHGLMPFFSIKLPLFCVNTEVKTKTQNNIIETKNYVELPCPVFFFSYEYILVNYVFMAKSTTFDGRKPGSKHTFPRAPQHRCWGQTISEPRQTRNGECTWNHQHSKWVGECTYWIIGIQWYINNGTCWYLCDIWHLLLEPP